MTPADISPADLAQTFIEKWASSDLDGLVALVDEKISYEGPLARAEGVDAYLEVVGPFSRLVDGVDILAVTEAGDQAIVMYEIKTSAFGTIAVAELLRIAAGLIVSSRLVFDTHPVRLAESSE